MGAVASQQGPLPTKQEGGIDRKTSALVRFSCGSSRMLGRLGIVLCAVGYYHGQPTGSLVMFFWFQNIDDVHPMYRSSNRAQYRSRGSANRTRTFSIKRATWP